LIPFISLFLDLIDSLDLSTFFDEEMTVRVLLILAEVSLMNEISVLSWVSWGKLRVSLVFLRAFQVLFDKRISEL
jgi:hypothetical protein